MILLKNTNARFGLVSKLLHWTVALLILFLIWLGWYMVDLSYYDRWYNDSLHYHKSLGMVVLFLAVLKIGWQLYTRVPESPPGMNKLASRAARIMHFLLLALMLLLPLTGYFISTSAGKPIQVFNWFPFPALVDVDRDLRDLAIDAHFYLAYAALVLAAGHAAAAIKHQFIIRDGTLKRMLWG